MKGWQHLLLFTLLLAKAGIACAQNYWKLPPLYDYGNALKRKFIITTPGYMGPNALPVPEVKNGLVEDNFYLKAGGEMHFGNGDFTRNAYAKLYYPVVPGKVAIEVYGIPYEAYTVTEALKKERRILDVNTAGHAWGDYYVGTILQLLKNKPILPDLAVAFTFKTASGNHLLNARFTDAPAYFFDLSFGKNILQSENSLIRKLRIYGSGGLYVWQTNSDLHPQDDALLYGLGCEAHLKNWRLNQTIAGYYGYLNLRDRPCVSRSQVTRNLGLLELTLEYQAGLNHFNYNSLKLACTVYPFRKKPEILTAQLAKR